jgi:thymidylate synthase ThyX
MYQVRVLADSVSRNQVRLTTLEVTLPRIVLAEFNTHRTFSRNSASSRAIPAEKMIARVQRAPFIPETWGTNKPGMQAGDALPTQQAKAAEAAWLRARDCAVKSAEELIALGVHKQLANRLLEPFMWHTVLVTSTEWENFLNLRCHPDAQPEIQVAASMMRDTLAMSTPSLVEDGEWHLPFVSTEERASAPYERLLLVSAGRCARLSYLTHHGQRDMQQDVDLALKLRASGHMSPFEHQARPADDTRRWSGNLRGWVQYRKTLHGEDVFMGLPQR